MAKPGPRKTPKAVLQARGSWRARDRPDETSAVGGEPDCPEWLGHDARAVWSRMLPLLRALGTLADVDGYLLACYCDLVAMYGAASRRCEEQGIVHGDEDGTVTHGHFRALISLSRELRLVGGALGIGAGERASAIPSSRERPDKSPKDRYLSRTSS